MVQLKLHMCERSAPCMLCRRVVATSEPVICRNADVLPGIECYHHLDTTTAELSELAGYNTLSVDAQQTLCSWAQSNRKQGAIAAESADPGPVKKHVIYAHQPEETYASDLECASNMELPESEAEISGESSLVGVAPGKKCVIGEVVSADAIARSPTSAEHGITATERLGINTCDIDKEYARDTEVRYLAGEKAVGKTAQIDVTAAEQRARGMREEMLNRSSKRAHLDGSLDFALDVESDHSQEPQSLADELDRRSSTFTDIVNRLHREDDHHSIPPEWLHAASDNKQPPAFTSSALQAPPELIGAFELNHPGYGNTEATAINILSSLPATHVASGEKDTVVLLPNALHRNEAVGPDAIGITAEDRFARSRIEADNPTSNDDNLVPGQSRDVFPHAHINTKGKNPTAERYSVRLPSILADGDADAEPFTDSKLISPESNVCVVTESANEPLQDVECGTCRDIAHKAGSGPRTVDGTTTEAEAEAIVECSRDPDRLPDILSALPGCSPQYVPLHVMHTHATTLSDTTHWPKTTTQSSSNNPKARYTGILDGGEVSARPHHTPANTLDFGHLHRTSHENSQPSFGVIPKQPDSPHDGTRIPLKISLQQLEQAAEPTVATKLWQLNQQALKRSDSLKTTQPASTVAGDYSATHDKPGFPFIQAHQTYTYTQPMPKQANRAWVENIHQHTSVTQPPVLPIGSVPLSTFSSNIRGLDDRAEANEYGTESDVSVNTPPINDLITNFSNWRDYARSDAINRDPVSVIKQVLKLLGLVTTGRKSVLISRIREEAATERPFAERMRARHFQRTRAEPQVGSIVSEDEGSVLSVIVQRDLHQTTRDDLKITCKRLGLRTGGTKAQIIDRLEKYQNQKTVGSDA